MTEPHLILLFSGKRKCGKDFLCEKLLKNLGSDATIVRISAPLKSHYAKVNNLNLKELMSDGVYKERFRLDMITWSDGVRAKDPGYFCRAACEEAPKTKIWVVSDIRRKTDIQWFINTYSDKIKTIRINTKQDIREERGFVFQEGVDNAISECDLDDWNSWDLTFDNNSTEDADLIIAKISNFIKLNCK